MKDALLFIVDYLKKKGIDYGDIRYERITGESIQVRGGVIEGFSTDLSEGIGIRVLWKGAWGFAASRIITEKDAVKTADEAISLAAAFSAVNQGKVKLAECRAHVDTFISPFKIDPFKVPPEEKIGRLIEITASALKVRDIKVCEAFMEFTRVEKKFLSTDGADISQTILTSGCGYHVIAEDGKEAQRRSYPDAHHGLFATKGFELFDELKMLESVKRVTDEARALLKAKEYPGKITDVILDGPQLALQLHESCGHPAELDRALGSEISFAGGSFLTVDKRGEYRYGSKDVNIYADPTLAGGAGSYKYDDEGVKAGRIDLVKNGIFLNYLTSRESAAVIGAESNGSMRADGWISPPLVRMSNICLEPGDASLEDLISDTKDGVMLSTNRSWSIDDLRLNFQFGTEVAYEIKNGRIGQIFKNPVYSGITPEFWASCDGITNEKEWRLWGLNSCAKGEPMQIASVGHGASPARFRKVSVGVLRGGGE